MDAPEAGTEIPRFLMEAELRFRALLVPEDEVELLLWDKLAAELPEGEEVADHDYGALLYTVEAYDTVTERAEVRVEAPVRRL